jgi:CheY-like chemotaxis protein
MKPRRKLLRSENMAKILVVDDDPDFVRLTRTILRSQDYEVVTAANGEQALAAMRKEKPDLVLLDIMMSYILDGLDVGREMAEDAELKDIPVIMVTSLTGARAQAALPSDEYIPVEDWIHKPIDPDELLKRIKAVLG